MVRRIAAAAAVAAAAGFIAAGPAVADGGEGQAETHVGAATQDFVNVGGHNGITVGNQAEAMAHFGASFDND